MKNEAPTHTFVADTREVLYKDLQKGDLLWSPFGYEATVQFVVPFGTYVQVVVYVRQGPSAGSMQVVEADYFTTTEIKVGMKRQD